MISMCEGSCEPAISPPPPANPLGRGQKAPSQTARLNEEGQRGWKTLGPCEGKYELALTGSSRGTTRLTLPSGTQCKVTGFPGWFPGGRTEKKMRGSMGGVGTAEG